MKTILIAGMLATTTLLAGCVSVLPEPFIPAALISLPADRAVAPSEPLKADVAVYMPETSRAFAGADIAVTDNQELVYLDQVRWADNAPGLMQTAVVNALTKAGGPGRAVPAQLGADVDYDVRWRIVDLSAGKEMSPVRAEAQVSIMDSATRRMVAQQSFSANAAPADSAPRARAAALAYVAQRVADQVADFVARTVAAKPVTR